MIKQVIKTIKQVFIPRSEFEEDNIKCTVDEEEVDCNTFNESSWIGVPAPVETPIDSWFVDSSTEVVKTEKQITHEEMLEEAARREKENRKEEREPENIHQKMYELATKNWTTVAETQGGSENFHEGPGGWNSGTGMRQFHT